ncbi:MarR family transcriptional regulator [Staphylococcus cohnii]|uniref:transcriptional regulator, SarA/Rot family n=1 Tax=Staphylococcus cohnii TaxID=29382 RepID=UPI001CCDDA01|nr:MarR family transcriptional regulator [Staphylococcus cohnii]MBZ8173860.1 MarR family transcriptional regulator [Staphylococcus cohnii]
MTDEKKAQLLKIYKKYNIVMSYIENKYKLTMNDIAILEIIQQNCRQQNMLMQPFLKIATTELDLSRTKVLASIRRLINQDRVSKLRSTKDERKVFLSMTEENNTKYQTLLDEIEAQVD